MRLSERLRNGRGFNPIHRQFPSPGEGSEIVFQIFHQRRKYLLCVRDEVKADPPTTFRDEKLPDRGNAHQHFVDDQEVMFVMTASVLPRSG